MLEPNSPLFGVQQSWVSITPPLADLAVWEVIRVVLIRFHFLHQ